MNFGLKWQTDEVCQFTVVLYNPLQVEMPITTLHLYAEHNPGKSIASLSDIVLPPGQKTKLALKVRFRHPIRSLKLTHVTLILFNRYKTDLKISQQGLNPLNMAEESEMPMARSAVENKTDPVKPYTYDLTCIEVRQRSS